MIMEIIRKIPALFLTALLLATSFAGCGGDRMSTSPSFTGAAITVVDMTGREVIIPENVESIAYTYIGLNGYISALGKADKIAAAAYGGDFYRILHPVFENLGTVGRGEGDMEALAQLNPDLFIQRSSMDRSINAARELGIPTIGIVSENQDDVTALLSLLGKALGVEERARELSDYFGQLFDMARELAGDIPDEKRKSAVFMGTRIGSVANGDMLQSFMIETAGGVNLAKDVKSIITEGVWPVIGTEMIFNWNPDFIFISNHAASNYNVETLMSEPAWAELTAVKTKQVYRLPSELDSWELPGLSSALGPLWMLSAMYPDKFNREQLDAQVREFYKKAYNLDVTPELLGY